MGKPIVLHLGDDIRWNKEMYNDFEKKFEIRRSYSMKRPEFIRALRNGDFGNFFAIYRPFWNTGGEMGTWDGEIIYELPKSCKIYASAGAGFDWVDTHLLAKQGILYCNAASACTESVADGALWLILSTFRLFCWSSIAARSTIADQFTDATRNIGAVSRNPKGKTLGIIGFGQIGRRIAEKASSAFGMSIIYNDVQPLSHEVVERVGALYQDLDDLLAKSDCVVIAAPFTGSVLIDEKRISKIKDGARIVNIARGKLLDENALLEALKTGRISAAGLDAFQNEPHVDQELARLKNVELTSHTAGASLDSHMGFERLGMENISMFLECGGTLTPVNHHLM